MGKIRQINGLYYIDYMARGLLYSQLAGSNLKEAQDLLEKIEEKIATGEALTISRHIDLPDFFERFLTDSANHHSPKSVARYAAVIKHFLDFLSKDFIHVHQLDGLTPVIMETYKMTLVKSRKAMTVNFSILLLRDVLEFGIKLGFLNDNPSLHVQLLPWPSRPERKATARYIKASELLQIGVGLGKLSVLLGFKDIARTLYFSNLIPLSRHDVKNSL